MPMNRTSFIIDGFNLYHSVREAAKFFEGKGTKWLNIKELCNSYLQIVGGGAKLESIYYFSALAKHLESTHPDVTTRHRAFLECIKDTGIEIHLARFKKKNILCNQCGKSIKRHEEKETDVAIASSIFGILHQDEADIIVIMSGDTDIAPAVRTAKSLFPEKLIGFAFPYGRKNKELATISDFSFTMSKEQYRKYQFPDPYVLKNGRKINKPLEW
jgi:uncharacterized LabA/DUF88 family protein